MVNVIAHFSPPTPILSHSYERIQKQAEEDAANADFDEFMDYGVDAADWTARSQGQGQPVDAAAGGQGGTGEFNVEMVLKFEDMEVREGSSGLRN